MKKLHSIISQLVLLLLLVFMANGVVSAKVVSGPQNFAGELPQAQSLLEATAYLGSAVFNYDDAPGSSLVTKRGVNKVDDVIKETLSGKGNITSKHTLNSDQALDAGLKHLGPGYKEIGKPGSGVFRSADGTKQFRIDNNSLSGNHAPNVPHFHLETYKTGARKPTTNNHIPLVD